MAKTCASRSIPPTPTCRSFFKQNAARYKNAHSRGAQGQLHRLHPGPDPPAVRRRSPTSRRSSTIRLTSRTIRFPDQVKVRHILIAVPKGADAKTDAAARPKPKTFSSSFAAGGDWTALAKSTPPTIPDRRTWRRARISPSTASPFRSFDKAAFSLNPRTDLRAGQEPVRLSHPSRPKRSRQRTPSPSMRCVATILASMVRDKEAQAAQTFAASLAGEAQKTGLAKTAAAHHLQVVTTDYLGAGAAIASGLGRQLEAHERGLHREEGWVHPLSSLPGEGYAVFQVADIRAAHAPQLRRVQVASRRRLPRSTASAVARLQDRRTGCAGPSRRATSPLPQRPSAPPVKSSDFVGRDGQVPDLGQIGQMAPQGLQPQPTARFRIHQQPAATASSNQNYRQAGARCRSHRQRTCPRRVSRWPTSAARRTSPSTSPPSRSSTKSRPRADEQEEPATAHHPRVNITRTGAPVESLSELISAGNWSMLIPVIFRRSHGGSGNARRFALFQVDVEDVRRSLAGVFEFELTPGRRTAATNFRVPEPGVMITATTYAEPGAEAAWGNLRTRACVLGNNASVE